MKSQVNCVLNLSKHERTRQVNIGAILLSKKEKEKMHKNDYSELKYICLFGFFKFILSIFSVKMQYKIHIKTFLCLYRL